MNTQHTPGPWAVDLDRDFTLGGDYCQVEAITSDGMVRRDICECPLDTDDHPDGPDWIEGAANARLIAAAPELLSALQASLHALKRFVSECAKKESGQCGTAFSSDWKGTTDKAQDDLDNAQAAIHKALGLSEQNVKEHAPPPLGSEGKATEELHGGCCVSSCSESSFVGVSVEAGFFDLMQAANRFSSRYPGHKVKIKVSVDSQPQ